ncbi:MAG: acyl-CoA/acyl-ACP dehydrogenase [Actinobacteria bacterium]|nr:acyl-CoA/acyl-ACP dehydrogenase [Actinomycetota bacterium]
MAETVGFTPTEEMTLIRSTARQFLADRLSIGVVREQMMSDEGFDRSLWKEIAELGWTGLIIPEEHGGAGSGLAELSVILEEMGRNLTPGPFLASAVLATMAVMEMGSDEQRAELLPALASGDRLASLALYEGPRDWGLDGISTTARPSGGGWVIEGVKRHVLDGHMADTLLVLARVGDDLGLFAVDSDAVEVEQVPVLDLTRRQATVRLNGVHVPAERALGERPVGQGLRRVLAMGSAALAVEQVGGAQRCLELSIEYAKTRYQFGRPIGSFQAVKHRCAEMLVRVEQARSTTQHAVRVTDDPEELAIASPLAASVASEAYVWVAGETIQVHGGIGFTWEHDAHLYLKRAKTSSLLLGDPRFQRDLLGRALGL